MKKKAYIMPQTTVIELHVHHILTESQFDIKAHPEEDDEVDADEAL